MSVYEKRRSESLVGGERRGPGSGMARGTSRLIDEHVPSIHKPAGHVGQ